MLIKQNPYDFKKALLQVHRKNRRDLSLLPTAGEYVIPKEIYLVLLNDNEVILTAARDFEDYLFTSMGISAILTRTPKPEKPSIEISLNHDLGEYSAYMGYRITINEAGCRVEGYDDRGVAQALYYLEDLMNLRKAPYLSMGVIQRKALFSPRFTQSPFGMFEYPDEAFAWMAHMGYDTLDLWVKDAYTNNRGQHIDMRLISERAARFGIDIYAKVYTPHTKHPDEEGAEEYYEKMYGDIFKACPLCKGIILVGEATQFSSRDPKVGKAPYTTNYAENLPTGKISPGWWPCNDYPQWVSLIKKVIRRYNPDANLVFSTYNWGWTAEEDRVRLIEALPEDISLLVTWDMHHKYQNKTGQSIGSIRDYSLRFEGPGEYFISEAKAVQKRGIRLYAIANTSGFTWDFGVIPYEPMGQQWIKRYENIQMAHEKWNLCGLVENIHFGFYPSIISELEKCAFFTPTKSLSESLRDLLVREYGVEDGLRVEKAMEYFSEAITYHPASEEDQYGAFRIGPSYPLWVRRVEDIPEMGKLPDRAHPMWGNFIYSSIYKTEETVKNSLAGVRIFDELASLEIMEQLFYSGIVLLEESPRPNEALLRLCNLAKFMRRTIRTGIHVKRLYILKQKLNIAGDRAAAAELIDLIEEILLAEKENVLKTIPLVQADSRLGWEPSMEYTTNEECLQWKLRQLDHELTITLSTYRKMNSLIAGHDEPWKE